MPAKPVFFLLINCLTSRVVSLETNSIVVPGPMQLEWLWANRNDSSRTLKLQLSLNHFGTDSVWGGVGFSESSLSIVNSWKTVFLEINPGSCSVRFASAVNSQLQFMDELDPWQLDPVCMGSNTTNKYMLAFSLNAKSSLSIPKGPSYLMFASSLLPNFHYALVDFESGDSQVVSGNPDSPNPWLIAHGVAFILDFSILMPLASFLILWDREKYYSAHNAIGVVILILLVVGWASLTNANKEKEAGNIFLPFDDSAIGRSHSLTGIIARFVAVGVCFLGVILAVLRMPKTVTPFVRWSHGIVGVALSFFGPFVVWNGWVRMGVTYSTILDTSPFIWLIVVIALLIAFPIGLIIRKRRESKANKPIEDKGDTGDDSSSPVLPLPEVFSLVKDKEYFLFNDTDVVVLDPEFVHPAGNHVLAPYIGKDITQIFLGTELFEDNGRKRTWSHSSEALAKLRKMTVCTIDILRERSLSTAVPGTTSMDEGDKTVGIIVGKEQVTSNTISPVIRFDIKIVEIAAFNLMELGSKVRVSVLYNTTAVERTYTIAEINHLERVIVLYIKVYTDGQLTGQLNQLDMHAPIYMSGCCRPIQVDQERPLLLLAGGTGIVPMISYMHRESKCSTTIMWWLREMDDIFLVDELRDLCDTGKILLHVFVSQHFCETDPRRSKLADCRNVAFESGRICADLLKKFVPQTTVVMSGPPGFITSGTAAVTHAGLTENFLCLD